MWVLAKQAEGFCAYYWNSGQCHLTLVHVKVRTERRNGERNGELSGERNGDSRRGLRLQRCFGYAEVERC